MTNKPTIAIASLITTTAIYVAVKFTIFVIVAVVIFGAVMVKGCEEMQYNLQESDRIHYEKWIKE